MVYHRKKASRPTHYELALKYAEQRKMRLEQERAEMERITRITKIEPTPTISQVVVTNSLEAAESKESDDFGGRPAAIPTFRPPLNSYERALMEADSESEEERRKKNKQQPPRPVLAHLKRKEPEKPVAPASAAPLRKVHIPGKIYLEVIMIKKILFF